MDSLFTNWILLTGIFTMALASPGPDFVIAVRNSITFSRTAGILTAIGFAAGVGVHVTYTLLGLAAIIAQSVFLFSLIKYIGAAYLIYIGIQALRSQGFDTQNSQINEKRKQIITPIQCLWSGFLTNVLNPKATLFFLAVFSQFIDPQTPFTIQVLYGMTCVVMTAIWFSTVAIVLTQPKIKQKFLNFAKWIDKACGCMLIALGIKLALTKATTE